MSSSCPTLTRLRSPPDTPRRKKPPGRDGQQQVQEHEREKGLDRISIKAWVAGTGGRAEALPDYCR